MPYDVAERGLRLFAKEVLPELQTWTTVGASQAAD
jgi:hypothetical protein